MLIKANPLEFKNKDILHPLIRNLKGLVILDYRDRGRNTKIVPIKFLDKIVLVNKNAFIQNNKILSKIIRKKVLSYISGDNLLCIGGESYIYSFFTSMKTTFITNNNIILQDAIFNKQFYNNNLITKLVNYNKDTFISHTDCLILNLSKLNLNIIKQINNNKIKTVIIISCHHNDFWKKIKYLSNYKLMHRNTFLDDKLKYFISINFLSFI